MALKAGVWGIDYLIYRHGIGVYTNGDRQVRQGGTTEEYSVELIEVASLVSGFEVVGTFVVGLDTPETSVA
jgi:hypothetical protein